MVHQWEIPRRTLKKQKVEAIKYVKYILFLFRCRFYLILVYRNWTTNPSGLICDRWDRVFNRKHSILNIYSNIWWWLVETINITTVVTFPPSSHISSNTVVVVCTLSLRNQRVPVRNQWEGAITTTFCTTITTDTEGNIFNYIDNEHI